MSRAAWSRWLPFLGIALALTILFMFLGGLQPKRVGDGGEYYALFYAWSETHRPWMNAISFEAYEKLYASNQILDMVSSEWLQNAFPALRLGQTADVNHFWFYSLLAFMLSKAASWLAISISPHSGFLLLHLLLLTGAAFVAFHFYRWRGLAAFALMTLASPLLWFFDKVHTELFTYSLTFCAVVLVYARSYLPAAFLLGVAATQNPSFALVALVPLVYRAVIERQRSYHLMEVCLVVATALAVLAHPVYYFARFGAVTPQLLGGAVSLGGKLSTFYIWIVDPDLGLLPNWPIGTVLLLVAAGLYLSRFRKERHPANQLYLVFAAVFLLVNFYAHSSTTNLNSGATPGLARYALWYLPLAFPIVLYVLTHVAPVKKLAYPLGALIALLAVISVVQNNPARNEEYSKPTRLSLLLQTRAPSLYDPPTEVFAERFSGVGEAVYSKRPRAVVGPDCRKAVVYPGPEQVAVFAPAHCRIDHAKARAYFDRLAAHAPTEFYASLEPGGY